MRQKIDKVVDVIEGELSAINQAIRSNSATVSVPQDAFTTGPASVKSSPFSNNPESINAMYQKVISKLFKLAQPILDEANIKSSSSKSKYDSDSEDDLKAFTDSEDIYLTNKKKELEKVDKRTSELRAEYEHNARRVKRWIPINKFPSTIMYVGLLVFIGVCEIPLNKVIFQRFGESDNITLIMAGTLAIAVPVLAHFIGLFWRQRSEIREYFWKAVILTVVFLGVNFGLGLFRADVLSDVIEASGEAVTAEKLYLNIFIFVGITTILFLIGVLAAYLRHDPSYSLEHSYIEYNKKKDISEEKREEYNKLEETSKSRIKDYKQDCHDKQDEMNTTLAYVKSKALGLEKLIVSDYNISASSLNMNILPLKLEYLKQ